jgi:hypothetical protein
VTRGFEENFESSYIEGRGWVLEKGVHTVQDGILTMASDCGLSKRVPARAFELTVNFRVQSTSGGVRSLNIGFGSQISLYWELGWQMQCDGSVFSLPDGLDWGRFQQLRAVCDGEATNIWLEGSVLGEVPACSCESIRLETLGTTAEFDMVRFTRV